MPILAPWLSPGLVLPPEEPRAGGAVLLLLLLLPVLPVVVDPLGAGVVGADVPVPPLLLLLPPELEDPELDGDDPVWAAVPPPPVAPPVPLPAPVVVPDPPPPPPPAGALGI